MRDRLEFESQERVLEIKKFLKRGLTGRPKKSTRELLQKGQPRRTSRFKIAGLAAASLICLLLLSGTPSMARAVSRVPVVGEVYVNLLKNTGLDLAYKAGFVSELDRKVKSGGVTLTVWGAYADPTKTAVLFRIDADEDTAKLDKFQTLGADLELTASMTGTVPINSWMTYYDEEEHAVYGIIEAEPLPWLAFNSLTLKMKLEETVWKIGFPVQLIGDDKLETLEINRTFAYGDEVYTVKNIVFTPAETLLNYTVIKEDSAPKNGTGDSASRKDRLPTWALVTAQGKNLAFLEGSERTSSHPGIDREGQVRFMPTESRDVTVVFTGYTFTRTLENAILPLEVGAQYRLPESTLRIADIKTESGRTAVTLAFEPHEIRKIDASIVDTSNKKVRVQKVSHHSAGTVELLFEAVPGDGAVLRIDAVVIRERVSIPVN